jgi:hypothetical protein
MDENTITLLNALTESARIEVTERPYTDDQKIFAAVAFAVATVKNRGGFRDLEMPGDSSLELIEQMVREIKHSFEMIQEAA